jgi:small-conductance mechanosensitive channel
MTNTSLLAPIDNVFPTVPPIVFTILFSVFFIYIILYSVLQVRQIGILQEKVHTNADTVMKVLSYVFLLIQIVLFVVALLIL